MIKSAIGKVKMLLSVACAVAALAPAGTAQTAGSGQKSNGADKQDNSAAAYIKLLPEFATAHRQKLDREMSQLKSFVEKLQPAMADAQRKTGFDADAMMTEFRTVGEERHPVRRKQRRAEFEAKYEPQVLKLAQTAGVDLAAQRRELVRLLDLSDAWVKEGETIILRTEDERPAEPPPSAPPDTTEQVLEKPFTTAGTFGENAHADAVYGRLDMDFQLIFAGSRQQLAFISQALPIERGVRRVRVYAGLDPVVYGLWPSAALAGYSSAEAIVNLRVLDGSRVLCSDRLSLARAIAAIASAGGGPTGRRPVSLQCEVYRSNPDDAATYNLVAEIEGWAGAIGLASSAISQSAVLQRFHVYLHRR